MSTDKSRQIFCSQVARIFREERLSQGLSMTQLAKRAGLSQQMVSFVERQLRNPTLDTMLRIANALGVDLASVITRASQSTTKR
jgi:transcriptional regulator with XRE-family HTH domain